MPDTSLLEMMKDAAVHRPRWQRLFATVLLGVAAVMVPWVVALSVTLPEQAHVRAWNVVWVVFDIGLAASMVACGVLLWRHSLFAVVPMVATATLLVCDAWFDVCLSWGTHDQGLAMAIAAFGNIPLVALLAVGATALVRQATETLRTARKDQGS